MVNEFWPEVEEEVLIQLEVRMNVPYSEKVNQLPDNLGCCYPFYWFKYWYLYTIYPFDRTIWRQIKTFSYWLIALVHFFPFYGT